jgi:hypothetical protein
MTPILRRRVSDRLLMVTVAAASGLYRLLRPSAREDLVRYVDSLETKEEMREFVAWAGQVMREHAKRRILPKTPRLRALFRNAPPGLFRYPRQAFRPRLLPRMLR